MKKKELVMTISQVAKRIGMGEKQIRLRISKGIMVPDIYYKTKTKKKGKNGNEEGSVYLFRPGSLPKKKDLPDIPLGRRRNECQCGKKFVTEGEKFRRKCRVCSVK